MVKRCRIQILSGVFAGYDAASFEKGPDSWFLSPEAFV